MFFSLQLRKWGWMHHLARHAVACYLTRGDLVSWHGDSKLCIYLDSWRFFPDTQSSGQALIKTAKIWSISVEAKRVILWRWTKRFDDVSLLLQSNSLCIGKKVVMFLIDCSLIPTGQSTMEIGYGSQHPHFSHRWLTGNMNPCNYLLALWCICLPVMMFSRAISDVSLFWCYLWFLHECSNPRILG